MNTVKKLVKTLSIIAVVIAAVFAVTKSNIITKIRDKFTGSKVETLVDTQMYSLDNYRESLAAEQSDIDGWTNLDKYDAGLNPEDGSDTDGDGLTDKEEIEVYGSDPLKRSTVGDFYTDGYKVENGMDINTYYDYDKEITFQYNECPEVIFTATKESDLWAVAEDWVIYNLDGYTVYENYHIYNYSGVLSIDVSDVVKKNDIKASDLAVLKCEWYGSDVTTLKYTTSSNVITLQDEIIDGEDTVIVIAKKKGGLFGLTAATSTTIEDSELTADGGVFDVFILSAWWGKKPTIYYVPSGNDEFDKANMDVLISEAAYMINANRESGRGLTITYDDVEIVTQAQLDAKMKIYAAIPWAVKAKPTSNPVAFGQYCNLEMITGINSTGVATESFKANTDALPFENFGSSISPGGNCSGIAHLTSLVYNTGSNPTSGSYQETEVGNDYIEWDISGDTENTTLTNLVLYDYKTKDFASEHMDSDGQLCVDLTSGEEEFVKMIGAYWAETNDRLDTEKYRKTQGQSNYSWNLIEGMMDFLDNGKILDASFLIDENSGHTINIVSYTIDETNPDIIKFKIYDNNFPGNLWGKKSINSYLYVQRKISLIDNEDTFDYYYYAIDGCDYYFSSRKEECKDYAMIVYDENWTILNDIYDN